MLETGGCGCLAARLPLNADADLQEKGKPRLYVVAVLQ